MVETARGEIRGPVEGRAAEVLTPEALEFVAELQRRFNPTRKQLLGRRAERQARFDAGERPEFLPETKSVRDDASWRVAPAPADLQDRRVEITGPAERKMVINALNSGARVFMADFEDANTPSWQNMVEGQVNLIDAVRRRIELRQEDGRVYRLNERTAVLLVRPRGWHLDEKHALVDGEPVSASLFDFGLYFFHNRAALKERGTGPYFYLPKLESHLEARLWNDVFSFAEQRLGVAHGSIKACVLIETVLAAFEVEEILYELRDHSAGCNAGRWDYIFSVNKKFRRWPELLLPDRAQITMTAPFMRAYTELLVKSCHKRGAHAIGGVAAGIPPPPAPGGNAPSAAPAPSAGWRRSSPAAATRRSTPLPSPAYARTSCARPATASTAPGWRTPTSCRGRRRSSATSWASGQTSWSASARRAALSRAPS